MKKDFIWASLLHLSDHLWDDEYTLPRGWYLPQNYTENIKVDVDVWDETVKFLAECKFNTVLIDVADGIQYEMHPEISAPNAWSKDFLKKKLDEIRALGMTPIPKLNFSACHDTWLKKYRRMPSTPEYYAACADTIREVCEVFDSPKLFHIGFDEEYELLQRRYEMTTVRSQALWWHDFKLICSECERWGARPWVWSDAYWHNKETFVKNMSKSVLQSNWFYSNFNDYTEEELQKMAIEFRAIQAYEDLDALGYDQIPCCSAVYIQNNIHQTLAFGKEKISEEHLCGYMTAPWYLTTDEEKYRLKNDAYLFYLARKNNYPKTL